MSPINSSRPGEKFRAALRAETPLQIVGAVNAYAAMLAEDAGFAALYISGAGVANASYGLPDLGITTLNDVLEDVRRITRVTTLPVLVDIDTGFGGAFNIDRTIREMVSAGAAAVHIEDQVQSKRCGHRPGKELVSIGEMCDRVKSAVDARTDPSFVIMARTDAYSVEGLDAAIERANAYIAAGADMVFAEAMGELSDYSTFTLRVKAPILANLTEFGKTPLFTLNDLRGAGVAMALYPLSAFRAMNAAAQLVFRTIRSAGTQRDLLAAMQTRDELYRVLKYHQFEQKLDALFARDKEHDASAK